MTETLQYKRLDHIIQYFLFIGVIVAMLRLAFFPDMYVQSDTTSIFIIILFAITPLVAKKFIPNHYHLRLIYTISLLAEFYLIWVPFAPFIQPIISIAFILLILSLYADPRIQWVPIGMYVIFSPGTTQFLPPTVSNYLHLFAITSVTSLLARKNYQWAQEDYKNKTKLLDTIKRKNKIEKALTRSDERFRLLVEGVKDYAIIILDPDGYIINWNAGAQRLFGYKEQEIIGTHYAVFFTQSDRLMNKPKREIQVAIEKGSIEEEYWMQRKDESQFFSNGLTTALWDESGNLRGLAKITRDMTEKKLLENRKDEFIGIASHELKTPLTSIKAFSQFLRAVTEKNSDTRTHDYLIRMDQQVSRMTKLVHDLLDVSAIELGKMNCCREKIDMRYVIQEVVEEVQEAHPRHEISIKTLPEMPINGDRERLSQVISNLLSNAIKYSPHAKKIIVDAETDSTQVVIRIKDFGIGIPAENMPNLFKRFYRIEGKKRESFAGLGLGLYISHEIIRMHGGNIWVQSKEGQGSTFHVALPH